MLQVPEQTTGVLQEHGAEPDRTLAANSLEKHALPQNQPNRR